ncbi:MAG TPA: alpha/beta hydrolase [Acidimicrobiales bacterium]|nr:alpha/beta hydrolase [Acidimicrobiales bacterium]
MEEVVRDGRVIRYVDAGKGPGLVFVHGWCGDHTAFTPQIEHFACTHRVVVPDLRGHGESEPADSYGVADFAEDVAWLTRTLGLDRPVVIGHSLGGMVAVEAAAAHPALFVAAIGLDAPVVDDPMLAAGIDMQLALFGGPDRDEHGPEFLRAALWGPYDDHDRATAIIDAMMLVPPEIGLPSLTDVKTWPRQRRLLDCVQPVLCIHVRGGGPTDPTVLAASHPNVMVAQTIGAGHFIQLEVPDQVHAMIDRFLTVTGVHS